MFLCFMALISNRFCFLLLLKGIKNADENELKQIATDPDDIHAYNVADFSFLATIVDNVTTNLCNSVKGPGTSHFQSISFFIHLCACTATCFLLLIGNTVLAVGCFFSWWYEEVVQTTWTTLQGSFLFFQQWLCYNLHSMTLLDVPSFSPHNSEVSFLVCQLFIHCGMFFDDTHPIRKILAALLFSSVNVWQPKTKAEHERPEMLDDGSSVKHCCWR